MTSGKAFHLPVKLQLLVDVVLIVFFFALDARDLVYKTKWLGPEDSYSFTTGTPPLRLQPQPLVTTLNASNIDWALERPFRSSGWSSFLQKCQTLHAFTANDGSTNKKTSAKFSHMLGTDCTVGPRGHRRTIQQLVLSSSIRVDSVAWASCKMLFHHRKPPICHSPIVRLFGHRYNMDDKPSLIHVDHSTGTTTPVDLDDTQGAYSATPGSDAESEIWELLDVISESSPISNAVCVEGFAPKPETQGFYTASFFGCGSPNHNHSAFVGQFATSFQQFHQNKAWLASDILHVSGMTYMIRENRRSVFELHSGSADTTTTTTLVHHTQLNFSSFGVLYTIATALDVLLLCVHVYSALEIVHLMLWPLYKSLASTHGSVSNARASAFAAEDCQAVLTASLYRSKLVVGLILVADLLHWTTVVPNSMVLSEHGVSSAAQLHAALSTFRFWVLVLLTLHALWDAVVAWYETQAFVFVHATYVTIAEVAGITGMVAYLQRSSILSLAATKYTSEGQRLADSSSFVGHVGVANAFPEHHDSLQNTSVRVVSLLFTPLLSVVLWSLLATAVFVVLRLGYLKLRYPADSLSRHHNARLFVTRRSKSSVKPDLNADDAIPVVSGSSGSHSPRPGSPQRPVSLDAATATTAVMPASGSEHDLRLPLEKVVDIPIRARSLVRSGWKMEKKIGHQIFLRPPQYLEHGIILQGGCLKTRFGFLDIVHPYLRTSQHAMADTDGGGDDIRLHRTSTSGSSSPRRTRSNDKMDKQSQQQRQPLVPLR